MHTSGSINMGFISLNMVTVHHHMLKLLVAVIVSSNIITSLGGSVMQNDGCNVTRCGETEIRFPFHLKHRDGDHNKKDQCVFPPAFQLSCIDQYRNGFFVPFMEFKYQVNTSLPSVYLLFSFKARVESIDYRSQELVFYVQSQDIRQHYYNYSLNHSLYRHGYDLSSSPFKPFTSPDTPYRHDFTVYNCSSKNEYRRPFRIIDSLKGNYHELYAVYSYEGIVVAHLESCTKIYNFSDIPYELYAVSSYDGRLTWSKPDCGDCEAEGQYCGFKPNSTTLTQCYPNSTYPKGLISGHPSPSHKLLLAGKIGGLFFVLLTFVAVYYATKSYKQKKIYQLKIEAFLEDYKALKPSRYSYADIKKITNQFKVKLGEGGYGSVFKGQLSNEVVVAVKVLNDKVDAQGTGEDFINEVSTIGLVHHVNVVRLVGYCADGSTRALVYEFLPNNSLDEYVYSRTNQEKRFLGWEKMQDIALGIAKGIEYLHQGCAQPILHFDIKPHNILLDKNFNPKVSDFGLAKLCTKGQSLVSMTMARGTVGYIAPEVFSRNFGKVSAKSDVYSFGMLLLEIVGARDHTSLQTDNTSETYFPEWVFHQLEKGRETRSQIEEIEEEENSKIAKKLTIVGLWCINWHPADRPSMKHVVQMLQEENCPPIPPNPFNSASARNASTFSNTLEAISESD